MLMCCVIGVLAMLFAPIALFLMLVFMYSFFDTLNLRAQIALGNAPADDYLVHLDPKDKRLARLLLDSHKLVGWALIAFGALIAYENIIMNLLNDVLWRWGREWCSAWPSSSVVPGWCAAPKRPAKNRPRHRKTLPGMPTSRNTMPCRMRRR